MTRGLSEGDAKMTAKMTIRGVLVLMTLGACFTVMLGGCWSRQARLEAEVVHWIKDGPSLESVGTGSDEVERWFVPLLEKGSRIIPILFASAARTTERD